MGIDHLALFLLSRQEAFVAPVITVLGKGISYYFLMRCIGRLAFPLFAFLLVEGFLHTRDRVRYGINLFVFALISEIPWVLLHSGTLRLTGHNVMFTLLLGFFALYAIEQYRQTNPKRLTAILLGLLCFSFLFRADYNGSGFAFIVMLYALRRHLLLSAVIGSCMLPMKWMAGLAFIPISMYNGKRGFIHGIIAKYSFYAFYPAHLMLIYWILTHS